MNIRFVAWVVGGLCALAGTVATFAPSGAVQNVADKGAQMCEGAGFTAYPRDSKGKVLPRPAEAEGSRQVGLVRQGTGFAPVLMAAPKATSTVEDVGPAQ